MMILLAKRIPISPEKKNVISGGFRTSPGGPLKSYQVIDCFGEFLSISSTKPQESSSSTGALSPRSSSRSVGAFITYTFTKIGQKMILTTKKKYSIIFMVFINQQTKLKKKKTQTARSTVSSLLLCPGGSSGPSAGRLWWSGPGWPHRRCPAWYSDTGSSQLAARKRDVARKGQFQASGEWWGATENLGKSGKM